MEIKYFSSASCIVLYIETEAEAKLKKKVAVVWGKKEKKVKIVNVILLLDGLPPLATFRANV